MFGPVPGETLPQLENRLLYLGWPRAFPAARATGCNGPPHRCAGREPESRSQPLHPQAGGPAKVASSDRTRRSDSEFPSYMR
jgi:hypothetical protein